MLVFVAGLPGAFSEWCDAVVCHLTRRVFGEVDLIRADTLEEVALAAISRGRSQAVVATRQPGGRLRAALLESRQNFVVALSDLRLALADLALHRGVALPAATQALASSCAALIRNPLTSRALSLHADRDAAADASVTIAAIADHLRLNIPATEMQQLSRDLAFAAPQFGAAQLADWWAALDADAQGMVTGALRPYVERPAPEQNLTIRWAGALFFHGDQAGERVTAPIDITGRPRCLVQGPNIMLPPGDWSASLQLLLARGAGEHALRVELCTDRVLFADTIPPQREGPAVIDLNFVLDDATEHPVSIRVSTIRAAFDGAVTIGGATLVCSGRGNPTSVRMEPAGSRISPHKSL